MLINVFRFYKLRSIRTYKFNRVCQVYRIEVEAIHTGEILTFEFVDEEMDILLEEMEQSLYGMNVLLKGLRNE